PFIVEAVNDTPSHHLPSATANEPVTPQITTAPTMPEHLEMTAVPTAPPIKTPTPEDASRPASSMHTAVQLTFSFEVASVQLTPSQQAKASVLVTVPFEINTIEFSPSFEIASVVLDSNSKQVSVQLPGANLSSGDRAPIFEIGNLQLGESGEIALIELNLVGHGPTGT